MANEIASTRPNSLIAGRYAVDMAQPWADAGAGLPAFVATDRVGVEGKRVAIAVSRDVSPRSRSVRLIEHPIDNLMSPIAEGVVQTAPGGDEKYFIVCTPPPGPPVSSPLNVWPDRALLDLVLRPIARVLQELESRNLTHRAIRPNNVFQPAPGQPVTLGAAWAAAPAMHQPAMFEPPYSGMCHQAGRGEGTIADDVYALGVLLLTLAGGKVPLESLSDREIVRWKLELGSFVAMSRNIELSVAMSDLLRLMLADDPEHRPSVAQLLESNPGRGRRLANRPSRRSQRPLLLNDIPVFDIRMLAYALLIDEKKAAQFLRNGLITQWLRRDLGDAAMAAQIEELIRGRSKASAGGSGDAMLIMLTIATLNPRMPLCWRGFAVWPDGLAALVAQGIANHPELLIAAEELLLNETARAWSAGESRQPRPYPPDIFHFRHLLTQRDSTSLARLHYSLNPVLPCRVPAMANSWVHTLPALLAFLDWTAPTENQALIDSHIGAFIAAHSDRGIEAEAVSLLRIEHSDRFRQGEVALLGQMQDRYHLDAMPSLAKWAAARLRPDLENWHNRPRREAIRQRLEQEVKKGRISTLLRLLGDPAERAADLTELRRAAMHVAAIDAELAAIDNEGRERHVVHERFGEAITGGIGLTVLILEVLTRFLP